MTEEYYEPEIELLDRERLGELQLRRLREQLARCVAGSALYRSKLHDAGIEEGDLTDLDAFARFPVVTKDELRGDQESEPPFGSIVLVGEHERREVHPSSGTTGRAVQTVWSAADVESITAVTARTMWQFGVRPGDVVQNAFAYGLWVAGLSCHYACARIGALVLPVGTGISTERQIDYLLTARSTVLLSTPSFALHIAEGVDDPERLALRIGCFGGEAGTENPATRELIERGLGLDAFDYYGLAEIGPTFASECAAKTGLHIAEDYVLVECVDPGSRQPVPDGELGVLVFTHLTRQASPMLRYWSNDYARLSRERCPCGRTHVRAVGGIVGRHDDLVVFKGAKFYPSQVEDVVRRFDALSSEFRIEVAREPGSALVRACVVVAEWAGERVEGVDATLQAALRAELGVRPDVRVEPHGTLERTAFKAVRILERGV